ncbi:jg25747, partial [Pararge aegeria aegeria]
KSAENCTENKTVKTKKRGTYRKRGSLPARMKKFKFVKLFCETCQIKFTSKIESDKHRETVHKEPWSFMCVRKDVRPPRIALRAPQGPLAAYACVRRLRLPNPQQV